MEKRINDFTVVIEQDEEGWYVATASNIPGCSTQGKSMPEVLERIKEAIEVCLEAEPQEIQKPLKFVGIQRVAVSHE